jgi:replicative DNA helicase
VDIERAMLTKAFQTGELAELVGRGIEGDHFADEDMADLYDWSVSEMAQDGAPPSMTIVREEFRDFKPLMTEDPLSRLIKRFVRRVKQRMAVELVRNYHDMLDDPAEVDEIELHALEMARQLTEVVPSPKARRLSEGKARKDEYERRKKSNVQLGSPIGIGTIDKITLGIQPHELVIFGGPPGGGKTTILQYASVNTYLDGKTVLFVSLEVEAEQILRKFDTLLSKVSYYALKALSLDKEGEQKWTEILERAEKDRMHKDIIIVDDIRNCTVDKVAAQQIRYKPGIVVVDYLEEMRTPRNVQGWEGVATNGRGLKESARVTRTPHITATQLNRMLVVLIPPDDDEDSSDEMELLLRKYRDGPSRKKVMMHWNLENMDIYEKASTNGNGHRPRATLLGKGKSTRLPSKEDARINPWKIKAGIA